MFINEFECFWESRGFRVYNCLDISCHLFVQPAFISLPGFSWSKMLVYTAKEVEQLTREDLEALVCERELMHTFGVKE